MEVKLPEYRHLDAPEHVPIHPCRMNALSQWEEFLTMYIIYVTKAGKLLCRKMVIRPQLIVSQSNSKSHNPPRLEPASL